MNRRSVRIISAALVLASLLPSCGGSGVGPTAVPTPTPATQSVTFVAYLDENENGTYEPNEGTRIPGAEMVVGSTKGSTAATSGQATLQVSGGTQSATVTAASLPPFYRPPAAAINFSAPTTGEVRVPITLPRGTNRANVYMAFGDSITNGEPEVGDGAGYRTKLETMLRTHFGVGEVANRGRDATSSEEGATLIGRDLNNIQPAFVMIHYGTNDWYDIRCRDVVACPVTISSLRAMVQQINRAKAHAFLATILPVNTDFDGRAPAWRNDWVAAQNAALKLVAEEEGAVLVDLNAAFLRSTRVPSTLFVDHVHPSAIGYEIMAQTWFDAITKAYSKILTNP
jgi:lysophospholipase L1-like esterase